MVVRLFQLSSASFLGFAIANTMWLLHLKEKTKADENFSVLMCAVMAIGWFLTYVLIWLV